jgi:hypothetical protein
MLIRKLILFFATLVLMGAPLAQANPKGYQKSSLKRSKHAKKNFSKYKGKWRKTWR